MLRPLPNIWQGKGTASDVLQVALETVRTLEQVLLSQEEALEKAKLLRPEVLGAPGDRLSSPSSPLEGLKNEEADAKDKIHVSPKMEEGWPQSWRLLRSQVEAHCLRWRLQRERCRSESLQQEVDMRSQRNADLQRQLEAAHAELALLKSQGGGPGAGSAGTATSSPRRRGAAGAPASSAKSKMVRMQSTPVLHSSDGTTSPRHGDQLYVVKTWN